MKIEVTRNLYFDKELADFIGQGDYYEIDTTSNSFYRRVNGKEEYGIVIKNVSNLTIVGKTKEKTKLICEFTRRTVLLFIKCKTIKISNIYAEHAPESEPCQGDVFSFDNSSDIIIENCSLLGSGSIGLALLDTKYVNCKNLLISDCTHSIVSMYNTKEVSFTNCKFKDNKKINSMIDFYNVYDVTFNSCSILDNSIHDSEPLSYLFYMDGNSNNGNNRNILFKNCIIKNNKVRHISRKRSDFKLINTSLQYQRTDEEKYYESPY